MDAEHYEKRLRIVFDNGGLDLMAKGLKAHSFPISRDTGEERSWSQWLAEMMVQADGVLAKAEGRDQ